MAKFTPTAFSVDAAQSSITALAASLCLALCMIVSLLGIKLWWFKHRLTLNHSADGNAANGGGGAQPAMAASTSSKDSKQQFNDPNEVRGVFRKRQEDDSDIVRPVTLPPIRIKPAHNKAPPPPPPTQPRIVLYDETPPPPPVAVIPAQQAPTREAPLPPAETPMREAAALPYQPAREAPMPPPPRQAVTPPAQTPARTAPEPPAAPTLYVEEESSVAFATMQPRHAPPPPMDEPLPSSAVETSHTATAVASSDRHDSAADGQAELAMPKVPVRVQRSASSGAKVDVRTLFTPLGAGNSTTVQPLECHPETSQSMEALYGEEATANYLANEAKAGRLKQQMATFASFNYATAYETPGAMPFTPPGSATASTGSADSIEYAETWTNVALQGTAVAAHHDSATARGEPAAVMAQSATTFAPPAVEFQLEADPNDETRAKWSVRRPASLVRNDEELWRYLEQCTSPIGAENSTWHEMEQDISIDFANHVEEEFNRIRTSYEANEADFLEISGGLEKQRAAATIVDAPPSGFGRNIDEDWESFEHLEQSKGNSHGHGHGASPATTVAISYEEIQNVPNGEIREVQTVTFSLPEYDDETDNEDGEHERPRATGYTHSHEEHYHDTQGAANISYAHQVSFEVEDVELENKFKKNRRLQQRRPTGYIQQIVGIEEIPADSSTDDGDEDRTEEMPPSPPPSPRQAAEQKTAEQATDELKPKPRLKVTFDTKAEEHFLPANHYREQYSYSEEDDDDSDEEEFEYEARADEKPKPMQRMTKPDDTTHMERQSAAMLFSSQVLVDEDDDDLTMASDSWTAIRKHRLIAQELKRISLVEDERHDDYELPPPNEPPPPPPVPASRKPSKQRLIAVDAKLYGDAPDLLAKPRADA